MNELVSVSIWYWNILPELHSLHSPHLLWRVEVHVTQMLAAESTHPCADPQRDGFKIKIAKIEQNNEQKLKEQWKSITHIRNKIAKQ